MSGESGVVVEGEGAAHGRIKAFDEGHEDCEGLSCGFAAEAGLALMKDEEGPVVFADDQIGLPMACVLATIGFIRPLRDMDFIGDFVL